MRVIALVACLALAACAGQPKPETTSLNDLGLAVETATPLEPSVPCVDYRGHEDEIANAMAALDKAAPAGYQAIDGLLTDYENSRKANPLCRPFMQPPAPTPTLSDVH